MGIQKNKVSYLKTVLEEKELKEFERALGHDKTIGPALLKIMEKRVRACDNRDDLLDDVNYTVKRANLDGRLRELRWLGELLTLS